MSHHLVTLAVGLIAQTLFASRILVQWISSERAHRVVSPGLFWMFSIAGSVLFFLYGWLRDDFSIILGQFISYYVYMWNLSAKGFYARLPRVVAVAQALLPVVAVGAVLDDVPRFVDTFFRNAEVPLWAVVWGSTGQVIFTLRFVYQWHYSRRRHESLLPAAFWAISLVGSLIIVSYGVFRADAVLILGQSFGLVAYLRNLIIGHRARV